MPKNIVFLTSVKNPNHNEKYGGFDWMEYSKKTWEYWCKKNNCELFIYNTPSNPDFKNYRITWQRWFDVFTQLENNNIKYNNILMVDATSMVKWDAPNIFDLLKDDNMVAWRDADNMQWIYDSIQGYKDMFSNKNIDIKKYINCGAVIINKKHKKFLNSLKEFYEKNHKSIVKAETYKVKLGTDQTPFNYFLQLHNIKVNINLPVAYSLTHMHRKHMLVHNWQLNEDKTPFFIKYGYVWRFNGFSKDKRTDLMSQTWEIVKENYV